ncbi:MAG: hypothetical protein VYB74_01000, partial [Cyanobacteriota bacterium]|nr:hypothetical protein [Cyanobacteriota bacterium]
MGIHSLPLTVLLLAAVSQAAPLNAAPLNTETDLRAPAREPMAELVYRQVLLDGAIPELKTACADAALFGLDLRL